MSTLARFLVDRRQEGPPDLERIRSEIQRKLEAVIAGQDLPEPGPEPCRWPGVDMATIRADLERRLCGPAGER